MPASHAIASLSDDRSAGGSGTFMGISGMIVTVDRVAYHYATTKQKIQKNDQ